ncbi:TetR/AcrR family transcriptional regulator [Bradyrhizobium sp. CCBAU 51765]|uniref:TetR/AcrR family transcriptional regulator n=1 Tax=Bradyrhizobium sp. CCBAU 51765 TaxID=1325102 RepID=UPI001887E727|nr:TetR family transcriptional regulator [Bradyrhizobium sp. CCBAU 51765]
MMSRVRSKVNEHNSYFVRICTQGGFAVLFRQETQVDMPSSPSSDDNSFREQILETARAQVRRHGEAKTNVVDIARALGTSHTTIYRHFRSKADIFDALVVEMMRDEEEMAKKFVEAKGSFAERLEGMVMALHARKRERFTADAEVYGLYRRIVEERPEIIAAYSKAMTSLVGRILADARKRGEIRVDDVEAAAGVVRDAVTVFVHPVHVATAVAANLPSERMARNVVRTICAGFKAGAKLT